MSANFVHLHVHTEYSLVDSTVRIPSLTARCAADKMPAVALTDQNNLFGLVKFYRKAIAAGVKPVIGVDLRIANSDDAEQPFTLLLLVQNNHGYRKLSELISRSYVEGQVRGQPMARREWLTAESCDGLIALSGGRAGDVGRAILTGDEERAAELLQGWQDIFSRSILPGAHSNRPRERRRTCTSEPGSGLGTRGAGRGQQRCAVSRQGRLSFP